MGEPTFQPNWASPLGETMTRLMGRADVGPLDLAKHLGMTVSEVRALMGGISPISSDTAHLLSSILGGSPTYWLNRDTAFRRNVAIVPIERRYDPEWLKSFPVGDLTKFGWVDPGKNEAERASQLLEFFGIHISAQWRFRYPEASLISAFRTSYALNTRHESVATWLRQGERVAERMKCSTWNRELFKARLVEVRALTRNRHPRRFFPELQKLCAECGVALAAVPTPSGCPASGATQFLSRSKALLMVSFRFRTDDQFWFSFFHEAGHLVLHDIDAVFIDDQLEAGDCQEEQEANAFAQDILISAAQREAMLRLPGRHDDVIRFAVKLGISPGIVVGQMQKAGVLHHSFLRRLKRRYEEADITALFNL